MGAQSDYSASIIRSIVPVVVALVIGRLARWGLDVPAEELYGLVELIAFAIYYSVVRFMEERQGSFGWLLGLARPPHYSPPNVIVEQPGPDVIFPEPEGQGE